MKRLIVFGALAVVAAACGSDGGAAATTAPPAITTPVVETTAATTTSSTAPTTTSTTTTLPPTTTTVPTETLIKQAVQDYIAAYFSCGQSPAQCDPATFTASQGPSRAIVTELATGMVRNGLYFSTDTRGSHINPTSVQMVNSNKVNVESCWYDAGVVLGPLGPDGQPTVVNDEAGSSRYVHTLVLEDGAWRVAEQRELEAVGAEDTCGTEQ